MVLDPIVNFLLILIIGIAVSFIFDRVGGKGWLARSISSSRRVMG